MSRHSSRLAIQSPPSPRGGLSLTLAYAGAALITPRSLAFAWKRVLHPLPLAQWAPLALAAWCVPMAHAAGPLPQGGAFVRGQGAISSGTTSLTIDQSSPRGVIDWHSFSIGNGNTVAFNNGTGATLNRVTGGDPSSILGKLTATGSLYLINPQGIVVGPSGVVSTGGRFVASTLDICNDAFMQRSGALTLSGDSDAGVTNLGRISSSGGDVFLIARSAVINAGAVSAPNGTAELAAGGEVLLQDSASSKQVFVQTGSQGAVVNKGRITAAQISLQAADGNVYALAGGGTRIRATGTANRDGHVWLVADGGEVTQRGVIKATSSDGSGGTVDTQATALSFGRDATVRAAQWNISTPEYTIDPTTAAAVERSLNASTSVSFSTTGNSHLSGDLTLASDMRWDGSAALTLAAYRNLSITPGVTIMNRGAGDLTLRSDASAIDNGGSVLNRGTLDWRASKGIISILYDVQGDYTAGVGLTNDSWNAAPFSGLLTQLTVYQLLNRAGDFVYADRNSFGVYALGRDIDGGQMGSVDNQFDGMGHVVRSDGPLFASVGASGVVRNVGLIGNQVGTTNTAGTIGLLTPFNHGLIVNSYTKGSVTGVPNGWTGGLVGFSDGVIERSWSDTTVTGGSVLGGLVAYSIGTITQSFAKGKVSGGPGTIAGGLVGVDYGTVSQSYATGPVSGETTGGLIGALMGIRLVSESFATGALQSGGGIVGLDKTTNLLTNVYWDRMTTTRAQSTGIGPQLPLSNGLTTAQMADANSFDASWNFSANGTWVIPAGSTHPILRWQLDDGR